MATIIVRSHCFAPRKVFQINWELNYTEIETLECDSSHVAESIAALSFIDFLAARIRSNRS